MVVQHNLTAQFANRQLNITTDGQKKSTEKLSSGYRINRAGDDAAGLAVSEKMRWQIRGLNKASTNIEDGISYVNVADGALNEVGEMLRRINELATQASNDTNTASDRIQIDNEIQELKKEVSRVFDTTEFNTRKIWDPAPPKKVQIGTELEQALALTIGGRNIGLTDVNKGAVARSYYQVAVEGTDATDPSTYGFKVKWRGFNGTNYESDLIPFPDDPTSAFSTTLAEHLDTTAHPELAGIDFPISWNAREDRTIEQVRTAIHGVTMSTYTGSSEVVEPQSGRPVSFSFSTDHITELAADRSADAFDDDYITPYPNDGTSNVVNPPTYTDPDEDMPFSFKLNYRNIGVVTATSYSTSFSSSAREDEFEGVWWRYVTYPDGTKYKVGLSYSNSPNGKGGTLHSATDLVQHESNSALSLKNNTNGHGGSVTMQFRLTPDNSYTYGDTTSTGVGTLTMSFSISASDTEESVMERLKSVFNSTNVIDMEPSSYFSMHHTIYSSYANRSDIEVPIYDSWNELNIQSGALSGQKIPITYETLNLRKLGLTDTNVRTYQDAQAAMQESDDAMFLVNSQRAYFGAMNNRLEHAKASDDNTAENTQAAESRVRDTDMAKEMVVYARHQILSQAGQSLLAQANQSFQGVLDLLQG